MNVTVEQLESIKRYLEYYVEFNSFTKFKEILRDKYKKTAISYIEYLVVIAREGLRLILENEFILDLEEVTQSILRDDDILVPVCFLESFVNSEIQDLLDNQKRDS